VAEGGARSEALGHRRGATRVDVVGEGEELDSADAAPIRGSVVGAPQERLSASVDISQTQGQNQGQQ
jgi:hypothetical protein